MIEFIGSIALVGWILIAVAALVLFYLRRLIHGAGQSSLPSDEVLPVGQPPDYRGPPG